MAALIPNLKPPTRDELDALTCAAYSEIGAGPEMTLRLVRHIRDLQLGLPLVEQQLAEKLADDGGLADGGQA